MVYNRTYPDFHKWATNLHTTNEIAEALKQCFEQGYAAGELDGDTDGWWKAQEWDPQAVRKVAESRGLISNETTKDTQLPNHDREPVLVDDKKSSKKVNVKMEAKK